MIYVEINGRLGNNLFEIAAAKSISDNILLYCPSKYAENMILKYKDTLFKDLDIVKQLPCDIEIYEEQSYKYKKININSERNILLKGYYQSYKYLDKKKICELFTIPENVKKDITTRFSYILKKETVCINVRRGDYLQLPHRHPFCGKSFFKKAMKVFQNKDVNFLISSDDIEWCKNNLKGNNIFYVEDSYPLLDLYIQTVCQHNIISNSSFSWWGAYLNQNPNKIVVAPRRWYGMALRLNTQDLLPEEYILLPCKYSFIMFFKAVFKTIKQIISKRTLKR